MVSTRISAGLAFVVLWLMTTLIVAQNPKPPTLTDSPECDDCVTLIYNPANGNLSLWVAALGPNDQNMLNTFEIMSTEDLFIPEPWPPWCDDIWVCVVPGKLARVRMRGFGSFDIGNYLPPGLTGEDLVADFIVDGSYLTGGTLDKYNPDSPFLYVVPEPSAALLSSLCIVILLLPRRRR